MTTIKFQRSELTARQKQVLQFLTSFLDDNGYPPSLREIASYLQVSGTLPVSKHLDALEKKGFIRRDAVSRGIVLTTSSSRSTSLPVVGTVRAGHLSPAIEDIQEYFSVDRLAVRGDDCFFLKVAGDSMIEAGILDGDLALVRPQAAAENGDTVVVMVNHEATLKKFYRESDHIRLQPANPAMAPIIVSPGDGEISIVGKVIGLYRRFD